MRRFFQFLGALCAAGILSASAQNVIPGNKRPPEAEPLPAAPAGEMSSGKVIPADSPLVPGDFVSVQIVEDRQDPWKTIVTDAGEIEISNLGSVKVAGGTAADAASLVRNYLLKDYYKKATVLVKIIRKSATTNRPDKATIAGKVGRPGPQYFNAANPLKLSEAVIVAGTTVYSDLRRVQLTRGGVNTIYNVEEITKGGRTDLDIPLKNGDQIFVRDKPIVF